MIFVVSKRKGKLVYKNRWKHYGYVDADRITMAANKLGINLEPEMIEEHSGSTWTYFHHEESNTDYTIESLHEIIGPLTKPTIGYRGRARSQWSTVDSQTTAPTPYPRTSQR